MAQLQLQPATTGKEKRKPYHNLKIDMTPLVDLGFLLITFFIFTTSMSEPMVTPLYMPKGDPDTKVGETSALTILLSEADKVYCYEGKWEEAAASNQLQTTNYDVQTGLGKIIRDKQKRLAAKKNELVLMIKPMEKSSYKNIIDALDEATINGVSRYAIVDPDGAEIAYIKEKSNQEK